VILVYFDVVQRNAYCILNSKRICSNRKILFFGKEQHTGHFHSHLLLKFTNNLCFMSNEFQDLQSICALIVILRLSFDIVSEYRLIL